MSTLPAIDKAAAPPAIVQILDEGAIGSLGFVHPQTVGLSASSVTTLPEQRQEHARVRSRQLSEKDAGLVAESWMGGLCRRSEHECSFAIWTERPPGSSRDAIPYRVANFAPRISAVRRRRRDPFLHRSDWAYERWGRTARFGVDSAIEARTGT